MRFAIRDVHLNKKRQQRQFRIALPPINERLMQAINLSLDPALIMLVLGQAFVFTQARKNEKYEFYYMTIGSMINLVLFNLSTIDYENSK